MELFISHQSALEHWRKSRILPVNCKDLRCIVKLPKTPSEIDSSVFSAFILPIHVMIGSRDARRDHNMIKQHLYSNEIPIGCFMNVGGDLMISSPEFCFLQMANQLSLPSLMELGYEFCGVYSLPNTDESSIPERGFFNRMPVTNVKKLSAFLYNMSGFAGHKKAMRALRYIRDKSASPMETKLAMFLTLPYKLGGYGFSLFELNKRIVLSKSARKHFNKEYYICDMFWPEKRIAVEYDSDQQHTGSDRIASDSIRRNALESLGIKVVIVTKKQLYSSVEMEIVARVIAKHANKRLFHTKNNFADERRELRKQLLGIY